MGGREEELLLCITLVLVNGVDGLLSLASEWGDEVFGRKRRASKRESSEGHETSTFADVVSNAVT